MSFLDAFDEIKLDVNVYVSNLGAYNAGQLTGEWVKLPVKNISDIYKRDREKFGGVLEYGDEYFISDYEAPFKIGEYQSLKALNEVVKALAENNIKNLDDPYWYVVNNCNPDELECERLINWNTDDDLNEQLAGYTPTQIIGDCLGNINWTDEYLYWDGQGFINSMSELHFKEMIKKNATHLLRVFADSQGIEGIEE